MGYVIAIFAAIIAIFSIILIHELGHFLVARMCRVRVLKFSIGFGRPLWSVRGKSGTEYAIGILPLGGYVKLFGDSEGSFTQRDRGHAFTEKPLWIRSLIVLAGPLTNFALAIVVFWVIFLGGIQQVVPVIGAVIPQSIAAKAGIKANSQILSINGNKAESWQRILMLLIGKKGSDGELLMRTKPWPSGVESTHQLPLSTWQVSRRRPQFLKALGIVPYTPVIATQVDQVVKASPADKAGVRVGDRIVALNGKPVSDWIALVKRVQAMPNQTVRLRVMRAGRKHTFTLHVGVQRFRGKSVGHMGLRPVALKWPKGMLVKKDYSILSAWGPAVQQTWNLTAFNLIVLGKMLTGKISLMTLGGPITIFKTAGTASRAGMAVYLNFIAFISIALGFINLLPIPGLDGGHLLFYVVEAIIRRPIPEQVRITALKFGIFLLITLMLFATLNDVGRFF